MTDEERAMLHEPPLKLFGWWSGIVSAACVFALTFLVVLLSAAFLPYVVVVRGAVGAGTLATVVTYVWIQRRERAKLRHVTDLVARESAAGYVRSEVYAVTDAVAVEEQEDEGLSYYLLLDDGRTLFLSGQYLYGPADEGFPWESFEIVRVPYEGWVLRVVPLGPRVTPCGTRSPFTEDERKSGTVPEDGTIEARDFGALKAAAS